MKYIVFDLEATCWDKKEHAPGPQEIIEIGAVMFDDDCMEIAQLEQFVKPTEFPILSEFCKNLTSIPQKKVDEAPRFPEAIEIFKNWIGDDDDFRLCSWGDWDKHQLKNEARRHGMDSEWFDRHANIKEEYRNIKLLRKALGMRNALRRENIPLDGSHHRGIDDARNIAKIFTRYFSFFRDRIRET